MKRLLAALLLTGTLRAAAPFEGQLSFIVTNPKGLSHRVEYFIKGKKARMDMPTPSRGVISFIGDDAEGRSLVLVEKNKAFKDVSSQKPPLPKNDHSVAKKTGRTMAILGYNAEEFRVDSPQGAAVLWAVQGLGRFRRPQGGPMAQGARTHAWERALIDQGYFPLKLTEDGTLTEVVKVEKKSLPDSLFEVPAGYKHEKDL